MNGMMIKALVMAGVLIVGTYVVINQMNIDLSDPVNMITFIGAIAIAVLTFGVSAKYLQQMKSDTATGELAEDNWDGIGEYKNGLPSGWSWSYVGTLIWAMWYFLMGYPLNAYSQIGAWNEETNAYNKQFEAKHKNATAEDLKAMGESIFLVQCAPCHGNTGDGLSGKAHDLTKRMSKEQVLYIIKNGANYFKKAYPSGMPAGMAQGKDAEALAAYVAGGLKGKAPSAWATCAGCHGQDGKGMAGVGPNIAGYDSTLIADVLNSGKKGGIGVMPAFSGRFTPVQIKALETHIKALSSGK